MPGSEPRPGPQAYAESRTRLSWRFVIVVSQHSRRLRWADQRSSPVASLEADRACRRSRSWRRCARCRRRSSRRPRHRRRTSPSWRSRRSRARCPRRRHSTRTPGGRAVHAQERAQHVHAARDERKGTQHEQEIGIGDVPVAIHEPDEIVSERRRRTPSRSFPRARTGAWTSERCGTGRVAAGVRGPVQARSAHERAVRLQDRHDEVRHGAKGRRGFEATEQRQHQIERQSLREGQHAGPAGPSEEGPVVAAPAPACRWTAALAATGDRSCGE